MLCSTSLSPVKLDLLKFDKTFHKFNQEYFCQIHIYGTATSSWTVFLSLTEDFSVWQNLFPVQHYFSLFKLRICWFSTFFLCCSTLFWVSWSELRVSLNNTRACWTESSEEIPRWKWNESTGPIFIITADNHEDLLLILLCFKWIKIFL